MLALTRAAAEAVRELTAASGALEEGGVRIFTADGPEGDKALELAVATAPASGDQVFFTDEGARVFLAAQAAEFLDDKVLDVGQDDSGQAAFALFEQPQAAGGRSPNGSGPSAG
ncbi:hypothetical protein [Nocardia sp. NPDC052566]|uniref:hypothetical protein n=1 Tax=Nocardia sp. NPDC052566 TaxID=3364330 RepID=UPI0037C88DF3